MGYQMARLQIILSEFGGHFNLCNTYNSYKVRFNYGMFTHKLESARGSYFHLNCQK